MFRYNVKSTRRQQHIAHVKTFHLHKSPSQNQESVYHNISPVEQWPGRTLQWHSSRQTSPICKWTSGILDLVFRRHSLCIQHPGTRFYSSTSVWSGRFQSTTSYAYRGWGRAKIPTVRCWVPRSFPLKLHRLQFFGAAPTNRGTAPI